MSFLNGPDILRRPRGVRPPEVKRESARMFIAFPVSPETTLHMSTGTRTSTNNNNNNLATSRTPIIRPAEGCSQTLDTTIVRVLFWFTKRLHLP